MFRPFALKSLFTSSMSRLAPTIVSSTSTGSSVRTLHHAAALSTLPRDLISLNDYSAEQIAALVESAAEFKRKTKHEGQSFHPDAPLRGQSIALLFSKRSTRTRVASETSIAYLGGHAMFLGKEDIQLGVNESLRDSAEVISSMVSGIFARVGAHSEITALAEHSSVPVINALCDENHPTQILADLLTIWEIYGARRPRAQSMLEVFRGLRVAWVGDANNVVYEMLAAMPKCGLDMSVCTPAKYPVPEAVRMQADADAKAANVQVEFFTDPKLAVKDADIIVTDTWVSMGQEAEKAQRMSDFAGYQVSMEMAESGGAKRDWTFMHCLPRKPEEVTDEVFYSDRSVVFQEAENRKWTILAAFAALLARRN
ncbi:ornithine carbamoyltransferase [Kickxella alabastrina]|uniref:ornithine carbamoyltransferase n=1 Tax=Kickxella alabastrina TaxID=61397 RepID=UPI00221F0BBF|nr:ornithine carbamoyltransferase [Kickxella alabastrina]KAI7834447.1 ornithine carbamoyltransferase [Kickxella alabastrina]